MIKEIKNNYQNKENKYYENHRGTLQEQAKNKCRDLSGKEKDEKRRISKKKIRKYV